jgi:hypothetical protein
MASELAVWPESAPPEEGRKPSSRPVDLVHLSRYTLGERALEREVLELFCVQSVVYLERLRQGAVRPGLEGRRPLTLKGSATAIGAWRAADAAQRAEALSGETLIEARDFRLREIESSLREAETYIGSLLKDR